MATEAELRNPLSLTRGLSPEDWLLRVNIRECDRRALVAAGRVDPYPDEPWYFGSPAARKAHQEAWLLKRAKTRGGKMETARQVAERLETAQWRAGGGQGILGVTSPLNAERRSKGKA